MSLYQELIDSGKVTKEEAQDYLTELGGSLMQELASAKNDKGEREVTDDEILKHIDELSGLDLYNSPVRNNNDNNNTNSDLIGVLDNNKYLTKDVMEGIVQSEDSSSTMTIDEMDNQATINMTKDIEDFTVGTGKNMFKAMSLSGKALAIAESIKPVLGLTKMVTSASDALGLTEEATNQINELIIQNEDVSNRVAKDMNLNTDGLDPRDVYEFIVRALPTTKLRSFFPILFGETAINATFEAGQVKEGTKEPTPIGESIVEGAKVGAMVATGGAVLGTLVKLAKDPQIIKNMWAGKSSDKQALEHLIKESGETPKSLEQYNKLYADSIGKDVSELTAADKTMAILNNSEIGSKFKIEANYANQGTLAASNTIEETTEEMFKNRTKDGSFDSPLLAFKHYSKEGGEQYAKVRETLIKHYNDNVQLDSGKVNSLKEMLNESVTGVDNAMVVKKAIDVLDQASKDGVSVEKMLNLKKDINSLNLKSTKAFKAGKVGSFIDSEVEKVIGKDAADVWKEVNTQYGFNAMMAKDNPIGVAMNKWVNGGVSSINDAQFAKEILDMDSGYQTFNSMRQVIGEEAQTRLEKEIVNQAFKTEKNMYEAIKKVKDMQFSTVEGRSLLSELSRVEGMISDKSAKELLTKAFSGQTGINVSITDSLATKAKYSIMGRLWKQVTSRLPEGEASRAMATVGDIIKDSNNKFDINLKTDKAFEASFIADKKKLSDKINVLKEKGEKRSREENKELSELIKEDKGMGYLGVKQKSNKATKAKQSVGVKVPEKEVDRLGIKPSNKKTSDNLGGGSKERLKSFLDEVANPKVNVDNTKVSELFNMLSGESTTMYAATVAKEKAWNKAMDIVKYVSKQKTVNPKVREQMIKAVKEYYNMIGDTI